MKKLLFILPMLLICVQGFSQKIKFHQGDFKFLKSGDQIEVVFTYDNLRLLKENYTEAQYIQNRKNDLNAKDPGNGEIWEGKWHASKAGVWEPNFMQLIRKTTAKKQLNFQNNNPAAQYILYVDAVWVYPGWDAYMMKQAAKVSTKIRMVDRNNPSVTLVELDAINAPGDQFGSNFSNENRIGEGFEKTGKTLGNLISKQVK